MLPEIFDEQRPWIYSINFSRDTMKSVIEISNISSIIVIGQTISEPMWYEEY